MVRDKKVVYKKKKGQIEEILTEREVLLRTIDLLAKKYQWLKEKIESQFAEAESQLPTIDGEDTNGGVVRLKVPSMY
ncbi:hypothetical protein GCK32_008893 [Trichostrongylus colubriformis]|uniref:Uncharacterized protein n=1 Tax=Trichostrongylus colubriformis TaxID=6319 RepID=A0AAN8FMB8_TRICO